MKKTLRKLTAAAAVILGVSYASAEPTVLLEADFSELTAGSEDAPEMFRFTSDFTSQYSGWGLSSASNLGQAGGSLYIKDGAYVRTPYLTGVDTSNGAIKVSMELKLRNANMGMVQLQWGYSSTFTTEVYSDDWTTVEFMITPTSSGSYSNYGQISPYIVFDGMFLKSIKIEQGKEFIGAPTAYLPTKADGTSFEARWRTVSGATKYFIDVYSKNSDGSISMFLENKEVLPATATASYIYYTVEGLDPKTTYYYVVRAANDDAVSGDSEEIEVVKIVSSLATPVVKVDAAADGSYTASWDAVADATGYIINVFCHTTLTEPGLANVLNEPFDCFTTGTPFDYEYAYDRHLALLNEPGWTGNNMAYYNGGMGLTPYTSAGSSYLETPALDLSADGGKVTVIIDAATVYAGAYAAAGTLSFQLEDAEGNFTEPVNLKIDKAGFASYTVELEGGTAASKVKIMDADENTSYRYFFNDITIAQVKPAGYVNTTTYAQDDVAEPSYSSKVEVKDNASYEITVMAYAPTVSGNEIVYVYSSASESVAISSKSGVDNVAVAGDDTVSFKSLGNGMLEVSADAAATVEVYDLAGRKLSAVNVAPGVTTLGVNATGIVIVKAGNTVAKIAL